MIVPFDDLLPVVTRSASWEWMRTRYLPDGPVCPSCASTITGERALVAWSELRQVYCAGCGSRFAATVGTPINETSWQPEEYLQLLLMLDSMRSVPAVAQILGKSPTCVREMIERIKLAHAGSVAA